MSRMWEVDPETRKKLLQLSKSNGNDKCCDCGAPAPQWASPKFGTFICLNCAGIHRGLGVHISFVRSITMDAFKPAEIHRMEHGGNDSWISFFDAHPVTQSEGRTFEDSTIKERYEGEVGEEWKGRLTAKAEGTEYVPGQEERMNKSKNDTTLAIAGGADSTSRSSTPLSLRWDSSAAVEEEGGPESKPLMETGSKKKLNEAYFAKLGSENATRSEALPPSMGGKFTGFGGGVPQQFSDSSSPLSSSRNQWQSSFGQSLGLDEFQKDPVSTLSKGLGWFASAVGKGAKSVNDLYIQPTARTIGESELAANARAQAIAMSQSIQVGARGAADSFNRFVEGGDGYAPVRGGSGQAPERKDFWDDFSSLSSPGQDSRMDRRTTPRSSVVGTAAMRKGPTGLAPSAAPAGDSSSGNANSTSAVKGQEDWGDDNW